MILLLSEIRIELQFYLGLFTCLAMLRWGSGPERVVALVWLVGFEFVDAVYHAISNRNFVLDRIDVFHSSLDFTAAAILVAVALTANRTYPVVIASFQLLAVIAHVARDFAESITPLGYAVMVIAPSWGILIAMMAGFVRHRRRLSKFGTYRDWRIAIPDRLAPFLGRGV